MLLYYYYYYYHQLTCVDCLLSAKNCAKHLTCISSFNYYNNLMSSILQMRRLMLRLVKTCPRSQLVSRAWIQTHVCLTPQPAYRGWEVGITWHWGFKHKAQVASVTRIGSRIWHKMNSLINSRQSLSHFWTAPTQRNGCFILISALYTHWSCSCPLGPPRENQIPIQNLNMQTVIFMKILLCARYLLILS